MYILLLLFSAQSHALLKRKLTFHNWGCGDGLVCVSAMPLAVVSLCPDLGVLLYYRHRVLGVSSERLTPGLRPHNLGHFDTHQWCSTVVDLVRTWGAWATPEVSLEHRGVTR